MYEPRTATVVGTIVKNGPNTRANMRVRICDCPAVLIALPPSSPMMITDQWSVCQTTGRIAPMELRGGQISHIAQPKLKYGSTHHMWSSRWEYQNPENAAHGGCD